MSDITDILKQIEAGNKSICGLRLTGLLTLLVATYHSPFPPATL